MICSLLVLGLKFFDVLTDWPVHVLPHGLPSDTAVQLKFSHTQRLLGAEVVLGLLRAGTNGLFRYISLERLGRAETYVVSLGDLAFDLAHIFTS